MGNKLSLIAEAPNNIKYKPDLKEPALQYYTAGWRQTDPDPDQFDPDAQEQEFSFATFRETYADYDADDEQEIEANHGIDRHAHIDDFRDLQIRRGREEGLRGCKGGLWKERKHEQGISTSAEERLREAREKVAAERCHGLGAKG